MSFPDVPGVTAVSDTLDAALAEASVALGFAFEDWPGDRQVPRTLDVLREDADFLEWSADAVVAAVAPGGGLAEAA